MTFSSLGLIIKGTRRCNLRCSYCHDWRPQGSAMSIDMLRTVVARALSARHRHVDFTWHGGEPLLLGRAFYSEALKLEGEFRRDGQAVENAVQTNGTLLDDRWCEFFAENQFHVGVSVDGPEDIHDLTRRRAAE
jgi:uncharacterized protein